MHEALKRGGQTAGRRLLAAVLCGLLYGSQVGAGGQSFFDHQNAHDQGVYDPGCTAPVYVVKASRIRGCTVLLSGTVAGTPATSSAEVDPSGQALQTEMNAYAFEGSVQRRQQMYGQLEARLSRRGFYRLWNRPLSLDGVQQAEAWYDAPSDRTVVCLSWATAGGEAQQVWVMNGKLNRQDFLPLS